MYANLIFIILFSAGISLAITPVIITLAKIFKLVDNPEKRPHPAHTHKKIIPRAGGLSLFFGIFVPMMFFLPLPKSFTGIFIGAIILIAVGLWDDRKDRSPYIRFITNCIAAAVAIGFGVGIPYLTNPFGGVIHLDLVRFNFDIFGNHSILFWADLFALVWIVWTTNIVGWSGGVDGQLPGIVTIAAFVIGLLSLRFVNDDPRQLYVAYLSFATAGAYLGFLPWNFYPQKIMPGYGGKTLAGFMLAILSILSFSKLGTGLLVLAIPMIDACFIFVRRICQKQSPMKATSGHLHHHLLSMGWGRRRISIFYWIISAITGIIALTTNSKQKAFAVILVLVVVAMFILWINYWLKLSQKPDEEF